MAPLASEPRHIHSVLNHARRRALYSLLIEVTGYMRSQLEFKDSTPSSSSGNGESLISIDPNAQGSSIIVPPESAGNNGFQPSPGLVRLRTAALQHFDVWRKDVLTQLKNLLAEQDDAKTLDARRKRNELLAKNRKTTAAADSLIDFGDDLMPSNENDEELERKKAVARLQAHWHAIPTRLASLAYEDRAESLSCVLLVLLSSGHYTGESRALVVFLASALELPLEMVNNEEIEIAKAMVEGSAQAARQGERERTMSAQKEMEAKKQASQANRFLKVGLASVAGAAVIGLTGGLAAPLVAGAIGGVMGSVGLGGVASFLGVFWMNGALVGTLFGAFGARMTGGIIDKYARDVEDFKFIPLAEEWGPGGTRQTEENKRRLRLTIGINGWLSTKQDVTKPWRYLADDTEVFALRYEMNSLLGLGQSLQETINSYAWNTVKVEILKRTVLATMWGALWPAYMLSAASALDNPFNLAKNRSEKAGEILADALINKVQGERPVTLVGYSLGARVINSCLQSLAKRRAFGLIENVVFIGAPVPSNRHHWQEIRSVVSGKMFNVYSKNDYLLAFLYRATSIQLGVAGLQEIKDIDGVENIDLSEQVSGHMRYASLIEKILKRCGLPVIKGVTESIDKDDDAVEIDANAINFESLERKAQQQQQQSNSLIDFDELTISDPPPKYTPAGPSTVGNRQPPPRIGINRSSTTPVKPPTKPVVFNSRLAQNKHPASSSSSSQQPKPQQQPQQQQKPTPTSSSGPRILGNPASNPQKRVLTTKPQPPKPSSPAPPSPGNSPSEWEANWKFAFDNDTRPTRSNDNAINNLKAAPQHSKKPSSPLVSIVDRSDSSPASFSQRPGNTSFQRAKTFPVATTTTSNVDALPQPIVSSHDNHHYDESDDDDEGSEYGGIKMIDNDDMEFVDPRPMDDY
ncbi:hypothetical protein QBC38DRAFT_498361 [Podospora fimiseda]|uniref:Transmembrane and coiled-coil domain-containing protein n=1 Tax=Podospora fimiseda TaxID=252190 RepID=A0AAN7BS57_9PEZI|nr:hypothetical protein QBC38DRAFT_498361 [Podospora fimiseda]